MLLVDGRNYKLEYFKFVKITNDCFFLKQEKEMYNQTHSDTKGT